MVAGHFGFAAGVKAAEPRAPLWALMLATAWLDVIFGPLAAAGVETIEPVLGTTGGYGNVIIHADYTHSLIGAAALGVLFGAVAAVPWGRRTGIVLGAVVFSHWLLDLIVHRGDLAILPGNLGGLPRLGFGLWQVPAAAAAVELGLIAAGAFLYWRAALRRVSGRTSVRRAHLLAGLLLAAGIVTLGVDVLT